MNRPEQVKVTPYVYTLVTDRETMANLGANGQCAEDSSTIYLTDGLHPIVEREVVLHELLHALWAQTWMDEKYPDEDSDSPGERIIRDFSPRLLALLRDNPELVLWLAEGTL